MGSEAKDGQTIAVWFSCGAASAVAAKQTVELYGSRCSVRVVNNPVAEEDADNRRFLADVQSWIGTTIEIATNEKYPSCSAVDVWNDRKYMSGVKGAPCTHHLKKEARYQWEIRNRVNWHVLGFTADEKSRFDRFVEVERANTLPVLIDSATTKADCFRILSAAGIMLPRAYSLGYSNANCIGCVKATSPTYWNHVRRTNPDVFAARATQSREISCRLVRYKGSRIFLDELPADAVGRPMNALSYECGIFCDTK